MARLIYSFIIGLYHLGIRLAAIFNPKAKAWVDGRKKNTARLIDWREKLPQNTPIAWMHCASLGEFEQGRPVLEQIRRDFPFYKIVLTFYSPSGFEQKQHYDGADWIGYLPADGKKRAEEWMAILKPSLAIFVKYEFWVEHLTALFNAKTPTFLIAASFRKDQLFFKWYGSFFRKILRQFQSIFTQTHQDLQLLKTIDIHQASFAGDPRIDRVLEIASAPKGFDRIALFKNQEKLFIAGSSWAPDENILLEDQSLWTKGWKLLLVPHEIGEKNINRLCHQLKFPSVRYSEINSTTDLKAIRIMVLDKVGMLSQLYQYGDLAYIGGGFGVSIHNTLEPAAFHLPILMGPKYHKFPEAVTLIKQGGAFVIHNTADFQQQFVELTNDDNRREASTIVQDYINQNKGATKKIMKTMTTVLQKVKSSN